jgi:hypothetical protein
LTLLADAARLRHDGVVAVIFYGSCLRNSNFDGSIADLYLLVDRYGNAFRSPIQALMNYLLPPNVFYLEVPHNGKTLRAKYAVFTLDDFVKGTCRWFHSYIWGRFAQPSVLVYSRDKGTSLLVHDAMNRALRTFLARTLPSVPETFSIRELWSIGLSLSYRCELRSEKHSSTVRLFDAAPEYYEAVTREALKSVSPAIEPLPGDLPVQYRSHFSAWEKRRNSLAWSLRQIQGKVLSVLRLFKALFTFENGMDYVLWKIERHSGIRIESGKTLSRFPRLAGMVKLWRLFRKGAFR